VSWSPAIDDALARRLGLGVLDRAILREALAVELGERSGPLTIHALLHGRDVAQVTERLQADRPLRSQHIVELSDAGPFAHRTIGLDASFWPALIGVVPSGAPIATRAHTTLATMLLAPETRARAASAAAWANGRLDAALVIAGPSGSGRAALATAILAAAGLQILEQSSEQLAERGAARVARDASWQGCAVLVTGVERKDYGRIADLSALAAGPIAITASATSAAAAIQLGRTVCTIELEVPETELREQLWRARLELEPEIALRIAERFAFGPGAIEVASALARSRASADGRERVNEQDLSEVCRAAVDVEIAGVAQRVKARYSRTDLVVADDVSRELALIETWIERGPAVFGNDGAGARFTNSPGLTALFHGPPGTGKTLAAQVVASHAGCELLRVDLATVVDKYIGETEKHLDRVFNIAAGAGAILFFDEADALFGKRTEITDSRDRYANLGTSYLLQRLEQHRGLSILASNAHENFDPAFMRRFQVVAEFAMPTAPQRKQIWERHLPAARNADIDLEFLAMRLALAGGDIRNAVFAAVLLAEKDRAQLAMAHVLTGAWREMRKAGRLIEANILGPWQAVVLGKVGAVPPAPRLKTRV